MDAGGRDGPGAGGGEDLAGGRGPLGDDVRLPHAARRALRRGRPPLPWREDIRTRPRHACAEPPRRAARRERARLRGDGGARRRDEGPPPGERRVQGVGGRAARRDVGAPRAPDAHRAAEGGPRGRAGRRPRGDGRRRRQRQRPRRLGGRLLPLQGRHEAAGPGHAHGAAGDPDAEDAGGPARERPRPRGRAARKPDFLPRARDGGAADGDHRGGPAARRRLQCGPRLRERRGGAARRIPARRHGPERARARDAHGDARRGRHARAHAPDGLEQLERLRRRRHRGEGEGGGGRDGRKRPRRPRLVLREHRRLLAEPPRRAGGQDAHGPRARGRRHDQPQRALPLDEGPCRLHPRQGPARRPLLLPGPDDLRRLRGQLDARVPGREDVCGLGLRLPQVRLVQLWEGRLRRWPRPRALPLPHDGQGAARAGPRHPLLPLPVRHGQRLRLGRDGVGQLLAHDGRRVR